MASAVPCRACLRLIRQQARASNGLTTLAEAQTMQRLPTTSFRRSQLHTTPRHRPIALAQPLLQRSFTSSTTTRADNVDTSLSNPDLARMSCNTLFKECARQADYTIPQAFIADAEIPKTAAGEDIGEGTGWWYENLKLIPTFNTWAQITFLHMYLLTVRLRYFEPEDARKWQQLLHDAFFMEAEHRMTIFHGISSRAIRNRYLKELYNQWRGVLGAYDEGLIKGDAVMGAAVWRNVFKADEHADWRDIALVVSFMRRGLRALDTAGEKQLALAMVRFGTPATERAIVADESKGMSAAFGPEDEAELESAKASAQASVTGSR